MKVFLRAVAVILGLSVCLALFQTIDVLLRGGMSNIVRSGALGAATAVGWLLVLAVGPVASIQLWRFRRVGLYATTLLSGFFLAYYFAALFSMRAHHVPFGPIPEAVAFNGILLVLLASAAARRSCT